MPAWSEAFAEVSAAVVPDENPVLTKGDGEEPDPAMELDAAILGAVRGVLWSASATFTYGQIVFPTARNGHRYKVVTAGTGDATEPTWPTGIGGQVSSGTVIFEEAGGDYSNIYNLRKAKYDALDRKVKKAMNENQYLQDSRGQASSYLYLNLVRERDKYVSIGIA